MGEIIVRKVRGMNWKAKISLVLIFTLAVLFAARDTYAAITTSAGNVTARATGTTTIQVTMPYKDDTNTNNTYTVQWKLCPDATYAPANTINGVHIASPFVTPIAGLTANTCYDIQATFNDADGVTGRNPQTIQIYSTWDNTMLHNSNRFIGSAKYAGGWGIPGGQYGQMVCETCHTKTTTNIKRIKTAVTAPSGNFPGQAGGSTVNFQSTTTPNGFGDDNSPTGHTTSQKVCEYCHSKNKYHNYNTTNNTGGLTHNNNVDCTGCHPHSIGFYYAAACDSCHGNPPTTTGLGGTTGLANPATQALGPSPADPGAHNAHVTTRSMKCETCHTGYTMPGSTVDLNFQVNSTNFPGWGATAVTTATYNAPQSGLLTNGYSFAGGGNTTVATSASYTNQCSNLYCHGGGEATLAKAALTGGSNQAPAWAGGPSQAVCGTCHGGTSFTTGSANPPTAGSHNKHANSATYNFACSACHNTSIDMGHVNGDVAWKLDYTDARINGGTYKTAQGGSTGGLAPSATYGQCTNLYCHSDSRGTFATPTWGGSVTCASCHGDATTLATGSHPKHLASFTCNKCHNATASNSTTISNYSNHVNQQVTLNLDSTAAATGATYNANAVDGANVYQKTPNTAFSSCTNIKCHNNGQSVWNSALPAAGSTPVWGTAGGCNSCHGNATYPSDYRKAAPLYTSGSPKPNAHSSHTTAGTINSGETQCMHCHRTVTSTNAAIDGSSTGDHSNGSYNVVGTGATYAGGNNVSAAVAVVTGYTFNASPADSTCSSVSCHPTGTTTANNTSTTIPWDNGDTTNYQCTDCHNVNLTGATTYHHVLSGETYTPSDASTAQYPTLIPDGSYSTGTNTGSRTCLMCHVKHNISSNRMNTNAALTAPRAMNLRTTIATAPTTAANYANSDYIAGGTGICISCHSAERTKDAARQLAEANSTKTVAIPGADFDASAHNYSVPTTMKTGGAAFNANCSKCHSNTGDTANFQTNAGQASAEFGTHDNSVRRLYNPMGTTLTDGHDEDLCYRCHSKAADAVGGTKKAVDANDWYGAKTNMTAAATAIYQVFQKGGVPTTATNLLYFRNANNINNPAGPKPAAYILNSGTYVGSTTFQQYDMSTAQGSTAVTLNQTSGFTTSRYLRFFQLVSPPVYTSVTIPSGSTFTIKTRSTDGSDTEYERFQIWKRTSGGANTAFNTATQENSTPMTNTLTNRSYTFTTNTSVTLNAGDSIVIEIETRKASTTSATVTETMGAYTTDQASLTLPVNVTFQTGATGGTIHQVGNYAGIHKPSPTDETKTYMTNNRHVECGDCHDPHAATAANPLNGVSGVNPTNGAAGSVPTAYASVIVTNADLQYQVCFKCHSDWAGFGTGTNQAVEFNTNNVSYHWVENDKGAAKASTTYGNFNMTYVYQMMPRYNGYTNAQLRAVKMRCSDCHGPDGADGGVTIPEGPHGSALAHILKVPSGSPYNTWDNTVTPNSTNVWCFNCHDAGFVNTGFSGEQNAATGGSHKFNAHASYACQFCHISLPHGNSTLKRLLNPATFRTGINSINSGSFTQSNGHGQVIPGCT